MRLFIRNPVLDSDPIPLPQERAVYGRIWAVWHTPQDYTRNALHRWFYKGHSI